MPVSLRVLVTAGNSSHLENTSFPPEPNSSLTTLHKTHAITSGRTTQATYSHLASSSSLFIHLPRLVGSGLFQIQLCPWCLTPRVTRTLVSFSSSSADCFNSRRSDPPRSTEQGRPFIASRNLDLNLVWSSIITEKWMVMAARFPQSSVLLVI